MGVHKIYETDSRHISWLYLFLGGFLAGIFLINLCRDSFFKEMELLNTASLSRLKYLDIDNGAFFLFVLRERLGIVAVLCIAATTYIGIFAVPVFAFWMGTMAGVFLSVASIRYGLRGILLVFAGIFPQYVLLVPACIMLMNWCYKLNMALYRPDSRYGRGYGGGKRFFVSNLFQLFAVIIVVIIGSALESYVNPTLLSIFLKIF